MKFPRRITAYGIWSFVLAVSALGCSNGRTSAPPHDGALVSADVRFADATAEAGLGAFRHNAGVTGRKWIPETVGAGGGFVDYDGDGFPDVVLVGGGSLEDVASSPTPALRLYRNTGDGRFRDVTDEVGLGDARAYGMGIACADYDNDGDDDLFLTAVGEDLLFRNDGARFAEVGRSAGVAGPPVWSTAALFFDADTDGDVDLFVGGYADWSPEEDQWCSFDGRTKSYCTPEIYPAAPNRFYRNEGDGTFTEATEQAGFDPGFGKVLGAAEEDFNRDGQPDVVVARDLERDLLYMNDGDGSFTEEGLARGLAFGPLGKARAGMGIDTGVVDSTGRPTVFVGNFSNEVAGVYRYDEEGLFEDRSAVSQIGVPSTPTLTFGLLLIDVDGDTFLDLFLANGHVQELVESTQDVITYRQQPQLFMNLGDATFAEAPASGVLEQFLVARGTASADYDSDGDVDLLVTENGGPVHLWRNDSSKGNYLRVRLHGVRSHPDGIGSRVVAAVDGRHLERRIRTGSSYLSHSETAAVFGLGEAEAVDSLIVRWPSGTVDELVNVPANQEVVVTEGTSRIAQNMGSERE